MTVPQQLRGFGPLGILAFVVIIAGNLIVVPLSAILVLVWRWLTDTPWSELGLAREPNWPRAIAIGIAFGVVFKLVMKAIVMPLLGAPPINPTYHYLAGNTAALPGMFLSVIIAGISEEILFRGFLFERLGRLFRPDVWARALIVGLTALFFGLAHLADQGVPGVEQATIVGLAFGAIYMVTRRLWMLIVAHMAFDFTAVAIIYFDLETAVAEFLFR